MKLSEGDLRNVQYFWQERGDITRWTGWAEKKPLFEKEYPELVTAMDRLKSSRLIIDMIVEKLLDE